MGNYSIEYLDAFGRYLILRQQHIYKAFEAGNPSKCELRNIYKERCKKFYEHSLFDNLAMDEDTSFLCPP